jgi:hypothetical protein
MAVVRYWPSIDSSTGTTKETVKMFMHPDLMWAQLKQHQNELLADADAYRLLAAARRWRRARGAYGVDGAGGGGPDGNPVASSHHAGNLAACVPHAAVPAR